MKSARMCHVWRVGDLIEPKLQKKLGKLISEIKVALKYAPIGGVFCVSKYSDQSIQILYDEEGRVDTITIQE